MMQDKTKDTSGLAVRPATSGTTVSILAKPGMQPKQGGGAPGTGG